MHLRRTLAVFGLLASLGAVAAAAPAAASAPALAPLAGPAVPIGGALAYDNRGVWTRLVELAGGRGSRFVVLATASSDPVGTARSISDALSRAGAVVETIPVAPRLPGFDVATEVRNPRWIDAVRRSRGVFFSGGAQERIVDSLQPGGEITPLLQAIYDLQRRGGVVAGTSAGAAVMSTVMFRDAQDNLGVMRGALRQGLEIDRGLGFAGPELFVDQHFLRRGRIGRMLPLMLAHGYRFGLGVDEDTAAIIRGGQIEIIGTSGALLVDLGEATGDAPPARFAVRGARLTYLDRGDRFDLNTRRVTPSPAKTGGTRIDPSAPGFKPFLDRAPLFLDILGDGALLKAMAHVVDGPDEAVSGLAFGAAAPDQASLASLGFEFRLYRGPDTEGWFTSQLGGERYTLQNVYLDVSPVRVAEPLYSPWSDAP